MHVVVAVTPAHPARRSLSKRRNQPATWFQLATVRLTTISLLGINNYIHESGDCRQ